MTVRAIRSPEASAAIGYPEIDISNASYTLREEGEVFKIPSHTKHRIKNIGYDNLIFIEIQTGSYFGEDDIIRYEDDYGRIKK